MTQQQASTGRDGPIRTITELASDGGFPEEQIRLCIKLTVAGRTAVRRWAQTGVPWSEITAALELSNDYFELIRNVEGEPHR